MKFFLAIWDYNNDSVKYMKVLIILRYGSHMVCFDLMSLRDRDCNGMYANNLCCLHVIVFARFHSSLI